MNIPFVYFNFQFQQIRTEVLAELHKVYKNNGFLLGFFIKNFTKFISLEFTIDLNSGTSADQLAIRSIINRVRRKLPPQLHISQRQSRLQL